MPLAKRAQPGKCCYQDAVLNCVLLCLEVLSNLSKVLCGCNCTHWCHLLVGCHLDQTGQKLLSKVCRCGGSLWGFLCSRYYLLSQSTFFSLQNCSNLISITMYTCMLICSKTWWQWTESLELYANPLMKWCLYKNSYGLDVYSQQ